MNCTQCASLLIYEPGRPNFHCPACQTAYPFGKGDLFEPHRLAPSLQEAKPLPEARAFVCASCGASTEVALGDMRRECPFCGNTLGGDATPCKHFEPQWVLPFHLDKGQALQKVVEWNAQRSRFQRVADRLPLLDPAQVLQEGKAEPVYLPFWIYLPEEQARREVRLESPKLQASMGSTDGKVRIPARIPHYNGGAFPRQELFALEPWPLKELVAYDPVFLSQVPVEAPRMELGESWHAFADSVAFYDLYLDALGGTLDVESVRRLPVPLRLARYYISEMPLWSDCLNAGQLSVVQCLLPAWICHLKVDGKSYRVFVNGASGEVVWDMEAFGGVESAAAQTTRAWSRYAVGCALPSVGMGLAVLVGILTRNAALSFAVFALCLLMVPFWLLAGRKAGRKVDLGSGEGSTSGSADAARERRRMEGGMPYWGCALPVILLSSGVGAVALGAYMGSPIAFLAGGALAFFLSATVMWKFFGDR